MKFRGDYWFLSNMFPCRIRLSLFGQPYEFTCAESAFQAAKCPARAGEFVGLNGFDARRLGRSVPLREDWDEIKLLAMEQILRIKFRQNPQLMTMLRRTEGELVEDNSWGDRYWGRCAGRGENHLGRLLMKIRDEAA